MGTRHVKSVTLERDHRLGPLRTYEREHRCMEDVLRRQRFRGMRRQAALRGQHRVLTVQTHEIVTLVAVHLGFLTSLTK